MLKLISRILKIDRSNRPNPVPWYSLYANGPDFFSFGLETKRSKYIYIYIYRQSWKGSYFIISRTTNDKMTTSSFQIPMNPHVGLKTFARKGGVRQNGRICLKMESC